jgi:SAM-dependent methyltransferase
MAGVANDGSPVDVYLALSPEPEMSIVRLVLNPGDSVLDLGSGPGRITNPLVADGHPVVAVDDSAEMLQSIVGATTVLSDILTLDLGRRFDVVLAASHLINARTHGLRAQLLDVCRRHVELDGRVILQRYPPHWLPTDEERERDGVGMHLHDVRLLADGFAAAVTYTVGARSWTQRFESAVVDDTELSLLADGAGLTVDAVLDDAGQWVVLSVTGEIQRRRRLYP